MQIARFQTFIRELHERCNLPLSVTSRQIYRKFSGKWFNEASVQVEDKGLIEKLELSIQSEVPWRERNSSETLFPVPELNCVVITMSGSPPRKTTRTSIKKAIRDSFSHAMNEFDASHDGLTGLLNAKSLDENLHKTVAGLERGEVEAGPSLVDLTAKNHAVVISFDIDHFKQVNDSYGHDYGDVVLFCFANRLETTILRLREEHAGCSFVLGRAGGEEFLLILGGHVSETIARTIGEKLRSSVADEVLPSDAEWESMPKERKPKALQLPHLADRKITCSVGVSSVASSQPKIDTRTISSNLRREADAALYRAKAGGRNTVRFFPEIRGNHGTVLQHHKGPEVVVIDIGTQVNVGPGQEFLVFHPDFTGNQPFVQHDGRSHKTLGYYPRRASGRVVVFDAQPEISFCSISENSTADVFPVGALLEVIPVGSITHLIAPQPGARALDAVRLVPVDDFVKSVKQAATEEKQVDVLAYSLLNSAELEDSRGAAFANRALAELFRTLDEEYSVTANISQTSPTMLAVLTESRRPEEQTKVAQRLLDAAEKQCSGLARFGAGIYCFSLSDTDHNAGNFNPAHALDLARYAVASIDTNGSKHVVVFSTLTAVKILTKQRNQGHFKEAISDYLRMKEYGVIDATFENQGALSCFEANEPDLHRALTAIQRANELQPDHTTFMANLAVIEWATGNPLTSYETFEQILLVDKDFLFPDVYLPVRALATFEKFRFDKGAVTRKITEERLRQSIGKPILINTGISDSSINQALKEIAVAAENVSS